MRINLKRATHIKDTKRKIYADLVSKLIDEYDLEDYNTKEWLKTPTGRDIFVKWLIDQGFKVKTYAWPTEREARSQGLEFDDNDPLLIALKLKHSGDD